MATFDLHTRGGVGLSPLVGSSTAAVVDASSNVVSGKIAAVILAADGTVDNIQIGTVNNGVFTPDAGQS